MKLEIKVARSGTFGMQKVESFSREALLSLFLGKVGGLEIPEVFTSVECRMMSEHLATVDLDAYDERYVYPKIGRIGPPAVEFLQAGKLREEYWDASHRSAVIRCKMLGGVDPFDRLADRIQADSGLRVRVGTNLGRQVSPAMIREINDGAALHFDDIGITFPELLDEKPLAQLALNCFFSEPESGGETLVYRRRWQPADSESRDPGAKFGFSQSLVAGSEVLRLQPRRGSALMFDPRNYHEILPSSGGRRSTISFFIGLLEDMTMVVWI